MACSPSWDARAENCWSQAKTLGPHCVPCAWVLHQEARFCSASASRRRPPALTGSRGFVQAVEQSQSRAVMASQGHGMRRKSPRRSGLTCFNLLRVIPCSSLRDHFAHARRQSREGVCWRGGVWGRRDSGRATRRLERAESWVFYLLISMDTGVCSSAAAWHSTVLKTVVLFDSFGSIAFGAGDAGCQ